MSENSTTVSESPDGESDDKGPDDDHTQRTVNPQSEQPSNENVTEFSAGNNNLAAAAAYENSGCDVKRVQNLNFSEVSGNDDDDESHLGSTGKLKATCADETNSQDNTRSKLNNLPAASIAVDIPHNEQPAVNDDATRQKVVNDNIQSIRKPSPQIDVKKTLPNQDVSSTDMGVSRLKNLTMRLKKKANGGGKENTGVNREKKKVTFGDIDRPSKASSAASEPVKRPIGLISFGGLARTVTTIAGLKRWKLKAKDDTQNSFEKYPGHLRVVQEHLRKEKTDTPLTIRHEVKSEVLPILGNIVKAYKKELVGKHRLLREANFKYEKLKSELQDGFL